jgi:hypothetical protein
MRLQLSIAAAGQSGLALRLSVYLTDSLKPLIISLLMICQPNAIHYVISAYVIVNKWTQKPQALYNGDYRLSSAAIAIGLLAT